MNQSDAWKILILQLYAGEFLPHFGSGTAIKKSSEDDGGDLNKKEKEKKLQLDLAKIEKKALKDRTEAIREFTEDRGD